VPDQGVALMWGQPGWGQAGRIPSYILQHQHEALECGVVFAAFKGHESPLRHRATLASCSSGGHAIWWTVEAPSPAEALALLPFYVAERTTATSVTQVDIP
jgi:hypothetical protein